MGNNVDEKKVSRIDLIGQNGNDGLHYEDKVREMIKEGNKWDQFNISSKKEEEQAHVKKLVSDHWNYIEGVLEPYLEPDNLAVIKFHYKTAMEHGWRHAKEYYTGNV